MRASKSDGVEKVFVLNAADLSKLHDAFKTFGGSVEYKVGCSDGLTREFIDIKHVRNYENPPDRCIKSIIVAAHSENRDSSAHLRLSDDPFLNVWIFLEGPESAVAELAQAIEHRFVSMRPCILLPVKTRP